MKFSKRQIRVLRSIDVSSAMEMIAFRGFLVPPDVALAGIHKARVYVGRKHLTEEEIEISKRWLTNNGYRVPQ